MSVFPKLPKLLHSQASSDALGVDNFKSLLLTRLLFPAVKDDLLPLFCSVLLGSRQD